jgi:multicomponent Na+:H+ antiporter subunit B
MAQVWMNLDSMDVSFTEASVGAGVSTVLVIACLAHVGSEEKPRRGVPWMAVLVVAATTVALLYGTLDMPRFGDPNAPVQTNPVSVGYIKQDVKKADDGGYRGGPPPPLKKPDPAHDHGHGDYFGGHVPNFVTAVIVSYRGYDTMYETTVILIAGISMILFLRRRREEGKP